jgi:hypothetical protein
MAHIGQSRPDSGPDFQMKILDKLIITKISTYRYVAFTNGEEVGDALKMTKEPFMKRTPQYR